MSSLQFIKGHAARAGGGHPGSSKLSRTCDHRGDADGLHAGGHTRCSRPATPTRHPRQISKEVRAPARLTSRAAGDYDFNSLPSTPEEHDAILRADIATFSNVVRLAGLRPK